MAGGLFDTPFVMNPKCILFSLVQMLLLYTTPPTFSTKMMSYAFLFVIFVFAYVAMAWYDYYFGCEIDPLKGGGKFSITGLFKPTKTVNQNTESGTGEKCPDRMFVIYLLHIAFIAPFIYYIGYRGKDTPSKYFDMLIPLAAFTVLYHVYRLMTTQKSAIPESTESAESS